MGCFCSKPKVAAYPDFKAIPYTATTQGKKPLYYNPHSRRYHQRTSTATWESVPGDHCETCPCTGCVDRRAKGFKWSHR
ncbi:hypothetical protein TrVFT333_006879 [Trichoderma virens FT-333]|nr:hypothetical protein TrVFT333_006879 [Trichoderma virens FT-333]